ncbi:MAG: hypothetical protein K2K92_05910 [Duncaniella sp.]|nr:hypothetical protein [Duncaniella sp.]
MDPLKDIFDSYDPILGPADDFMARLNARLDAVEEVRTSHQLEVERLNRHMSAIKRRLHMATIAAFVVGFLSGALCAMLTPVATEFLTSLLLSGAYFHMPDFSGSVMVSPLVHTLPWILTATISVLAAMRTYDAIIARPVDSSQSQAAD